MSIKRTRNQQHIEQCSLNVKKLTTLYVESAKKANLVITNAVALSKTIDFSVRTKSVFDQKYEKYKKFIAAKIPKTIEDK